MPSIIERHKKNGPSSWQAIIRIPGAPGISRSFPSKQLAEEFGEITEASLRRRLNNERLRHPPSTTPSTDDSDNDFQSETLKSIIKAYVANASCPKRHRTTLATVVRNIGNATVADIRRRWVKGYIETMLKKPTQLGRPYAPGTLIIHMSVLSIAVRWRADALDIAHPAMPFSTKMLPRDWDNRRERRLDPHEERALLTRLKNVRRPINIQWPRLVRLALETGARLQEIVNMEWSEIDINRKLWTLPGIRTKSRKTRAIPLSKAAVRILKALLLVADPHKPRVFHMMGMPHTVSDKFRDYTKSAGLVDFHFHDLRHEAITRMVLYKRKLSVFEIMSIVGHSSTHMLRRYANIRGDELVDRMD